MSSTRSIMAEFIRYTVEDKVAVLVIDHPPVNALNEQTLNELGDALDELNANPDVRVIGSWTKQIASHFGGTRQGMAISWPKVITDKGGIRSQFHHMIDIVPTILEAAQIKPPEV